MRKPTAARATLATVNFGQDDITGLILNGWKLKTHQPRRTTLLSSPLHSS